MPTGIYDRTKCKPRKPHSKIIKQRISQNNYKRYANGEKFGFQKGHKFFGDLTKPNYFKKGQIPWNKGLKGYNAGHKSHFWKGGIYSLRNAIRHLFEYRKWIKQVFERDNWTCQICGLRNSKGLGKSIKLEAHHHKKPFAKMLQEFLHQYNQFSPIEDKETLVRLAITYQPFWDINNGLTLCEKCHNLTKRKKPNGQMTMRWTNIPVTEMARM